MLVLTDLKSGTPAWHLKRITTRLRVYANIILSSIQKVTFNCVKRVIGHAVAFQRENYVLEFSHDNFIGYSDTFHRNSVCPAVCFE